MIIQNGNKIIDNTGSNYKEIHEFSASTTNQVSCGVCGQVFKDVNECYGHMKSCFEYNCDQREYKTDDKDGMNDHVRAHENTVNCPQCEYKTDGNENLSHVKSS